MTTITETDRAAARRVIEIEGLGDRHPNGAAIYLLVGYAETSTGDWRQSCGQFARKGERYELVHAISRWAGGEVRGYVIVNGIAFVRTPATPDLWPELDHAVEEALGCEVRAYAAALRSAK